jgi:transcriptional regulator with XRE-family HTH domain
MEEDIAKKIGERIRKIRQMRNLTLKALAEITGISISMISKIENCQSLPSISTYANIASALNIPLGELVSDGKTDERVSIVKADDRPIISEEGYHASPLAYKIKNKKMEPFIFYYPKSNNFSCLKHSNEEVIFIIDGEIEFQYFNTILKLKKGDCVYLKGNVPHGSRASSGKDAKAIIIQSNV